MWDNDVNTFVLSREFKQSLRDPNLYARTDGILMLLYVDVISMWYLEDATNATIEVKGMVPETYKITLPSPARQFLGSAIHRVENSTSTVTTINLSQKAFITINLKRFNMRNAHGALTPMNPDVKLDLVEDQGEKELKDIKGYQAIVGSVVYAALATWSGISFAVASHCQFNFRQFTSHLTVVRRVFQYLKSTPDFRLHFSSTGSNNQPTGYTDSDWANDTADRKFKRGHVFLLSNRGVW